MAWIRASSVCGLILLLFMLPIASTNSFEIIENPDSHSNSETFHECRFWAMISPSLPESVVENHLLNGSFSLKALGAHNYNGWGLAYYNDSEPRIARGLPPASSDPAFDVAAQELAESGSHVGVGHVRRATSGASDIPNPHPFMRFKNGKWWAYGHNGGLSEHALKELIGQEYLDQNPPTVGDNWSDPRVVDSDLYMLYILKCIEKNDWNVTVGVAEAVRDITRNAYGTMNFFLTDGLTLWGFRLGNTLYYCYNESSQPYAAIASQPPTANEEGWVELDDYDLITLRVDDSPTIISNITAVSEFPVTYVIPVLTLLTLSVVIILVCQKSFRGSVRINFEHREKRGKKQVSLRFR